MAYTLLATIDLFSGVAGSENTPYGNPANAILSDGSFCIAVWLERSTFQIVRVFHLANDLTVLGSADISFASRAWPTPYLVALPGNKVFMVSRADFSYQGPVASWCSCLIDCSGNVPTPGSLQPMATSLSCGYDAGGIFHIYDPLTDRIIVASAGGFPSNNQNTIVQVFRASTGVLLSEAQASLQRNPIGLYVNPTDSTKFKVPTKWGAAILDFTVALDGSSVTFDYASAGLNPNWPMSGGSPYIKGNGFLTAQTGYLPDNITRHSALEYWDYSGNMLASAERPYVNSPNWDGDSATLVDGRYLVHVYEEEDGSVRPVKDAGVFVGIDQFAIPPTIEVIDLPYYGIPFPQYRRTTAFWDQCAIVSADDASGIIIVAMTTYTAVGDGYSNVSYYSLFLWKIQGPSDKPNLNGGPLGVDVRFVT